MPKTIDLRSDTVTKPSAEMREAMAAAEVGDDVFGDDPTVKALEKETARILGKEAALFVPSGTMANQVALRTLCQPGDEVICERLAHIVNDEVGAAAALSGIMLMPLDGIRGQIPIEKASAAIRRPDIHAPRTRLIALENTHNRHGGAVLSPEYLNEIGKLAKSHSIRTYLDGARLWNAASALRLEPAILAEPFDMVSVCFSKGLGAPIGSAVCGSEKNIEQARRVRKMLGGGMRQVGIIAAAALYALNHNRARIGEDHRLAGKLAEGLRHNPSIKIDLSNVQTNIVIFDVGKPPDTFIDNCAKRGLLLVRFGRHLVRAVTHLDVDESDIDAAVGIINEVIDYS